MKQSYLPRTWLALCLWSHQMLTGWMKFFTHIFTAGSKIKMADEEVKNQDRTRKSLYEFPLSSFLSLNAKNLFCRHDCPLSIQIIPERYGFPMRRDLKNPFFSTFCFTFYVAVAIEQKVFCAGNIQLNTQKVAIFQEPEWYRNICKVLCLSRDPMILKCDIMPNQKW